MTLKRTSCSALALAAIALSSLLVTPAPPTAAILCCPFCAAPSLTLAEQLSQADAAALVSSLLGLLVPADTVVFGEIGLSGEVRPVGQADVRLREAKKLGFSRAIVPKTRNARRNSANAGDTLPVTEIAHLNELMDLLPPQGQNHPVRTASG